MRTFRLVLIIFAVVSVALLLPASAQGMVSNAPLASVIPFTEHVVTENFDHVRSVYAADLDGDGDVDILGAAAVADDIAWWENDGDKNFTARTIDGDFNGAEAVYAIDMDGDTDIDVLGAAYDGDDIAWWENGGTANFTRHIIDSNFDGASDVYAVDLDDDGDVDILAAAAQDDDVTWWENDGDENFTPHTIDGDFDGTRAVYAIDMDGDGDVDVLSTAYYDNKVTWWENDGQENFTPHDIDIDFAAANAVYAIDMDNDGDIDVIGAASGDTNQIAWWENDGQQSFTKHVIIDDFQIANAVYAIDVEQDGDVDVLGTAYLSDDITWWENDGNENFDPHTLKSDFDGARSVYATDLDGDGDVDILGGAVTADSIWWWEQQPALPGLFISDTRVTEGDNSPVTAVFTATLSLTSTETISVEYATADGSATAPTDYTAIPTTTLTFSPGITTQRITVQVQGDTQEEPDETFVVNLANPVNAGIKDGQGIATILDEDVTFPTYLPLVMRNVGAPASAPLLAAISNPDGTGNYTISWSAVEGTTGYTLEEDEDADFTSPKTVYSGPNTSKAVGGRDVGTYFYRVHASNDWGSSAWSNVESVIVTVAPPPCTRYEFGSPGTQYYVYADGRSWSFTVEDDMNVYGINTKSVLASTGGIFYIQVKINGDVVASWNRYVNQTIYQPYYHSADVSLDVTAGDTLTYFIYGGTVSNPVGGITGVNYVELCAE